jgi:hypothetical protein
MRESSSFFQPEGLQIETSLLRGWLTAKPWAGRSQAVEKKIGRLNFQAWIFDK